MNNIKIISVEAKKGYYLVTTSLNDYKFDEDTIVKYEVFNDKEFDKKEFDKILKFNDEQSAFNKVIKYLADGPRSKLEIIKYLKEKGIENSRAVIKKLTDYGYIDDEKLACDMVNYYLEQDKGPLYILKKMDDKGIADDIKMEAIKQYPKDLEEEKCLSVGAKEVTKLKSHPVKKQKMMLYSKLVTRGYSIDVARRTIDKMEYVDESNDSLVKDYQKLLAKAKKKELNNNEIKSYIVERLMAKGYEYKNIKDIIS